MDFKSCWWFWILLIVFIIIIFPKTCGTINSNSKIDYQCNGIKAPQMNTAKNNNSYNWCLGFCQEKLKKSNSSIQNKTSNAPAVVSGIFSSTIKWIIPLLIIIFTIALVKWLSSQKNKTANVQQ
jgi:hypothetical protein